MLGPLAPPEAPFYMREDKRATTSESQTSAILIAAIPRAGAGRW